MDKLINFNQTDITAPLLARLHKTVPKPMRIMEVCGTHTMAIQRSGLPAVLPPEIELISGPGCPVCVTAASHINAMVDLAFQEKTQLVIFGDLFRVPGNNGSLADARAGGGKINIVYSPMDALIIARNNPLDEIIFIGIGFETTSPAIAATIIAARRRNIKNFSVFSTCKCLMPALTALFADDTVEIDGLICPGHVSTIIGTEAYEVFRTKFHLPCVITGFETADLLLGLNMISSQIINKEAKIENAYPRAVGTHGNKRALKIIDEIFEPVASNWRGLGNIDKSGLKIRSEYEEFDSETRFNIELKDEKEINGCRCGDILKGKLKPDQCHLFGQKCSPTNPVGPCMVSSEGSCAALYQYGRKIIRQPDHE